MFIIKINEHFLILKLFWFNKHQWLLNDKNNSLHFKLEKHNHENNSFKKIVKIARDLLEQTILYEFLSNKFITISSISKFLKYRIFFKQNKFIQNFIASIKRSFKITIKNVFNKNNNFLKKFLNIDSFWNSIEINENNFLKFESILFKNFKNFNKITNIIIKTRSNILITKFIKRSKYRKKKSRKKFKNFKRLSIIDFEIFENN